MQWWCGGRSSLCVGVHSGLRRRQSVQLTCLSDSGIDEVGVGPCSLCDGGIEGSPVCGSEASQLIGIGSCPEAVQGGVQARVHAAGHIADSRFVSLNGVVVDD